MRTWNLDGLRKHAKAKGELPGVTSEPKPRATFSVDPACVCGYRQSSHNPKHPQHAFYLSEGMCGKFTEAV